MGRVSQFSKVFGNGGGTELGEKIAHLKHKSKLFQRPLAMFLLFKPV